MTVFATPSPPTDVVRFSRLKGAKVLGTARKHLPHRREYHLTARCVEFRCKNRGGGRFRGAERVFRVIIVRFVTEKCTEFDTFHHLYRSRIGQERLQRAKIHCWK